MSGARFIVQRPEAPAWFAGWDHGLALWVCDAGDAMFVRPDELVETMARLAKERPLASLYFPNDEMRNAKGEKGGDQHRNDLSGLA